MVIVMKKAQLPIKKPLPISFFQAIKSKKLDLILPYLTPEWDLYSKSPYGNTPLISAIYQNSKELIELLSAYLDVNDLRNTHSWIPLHLAANRNFKEATLGLIEAGANINKLNENGLSAANSALIAGHLDIVKLLVQHGAHLTQLEKRAFELEQYQLPTYPLTKDNENRINQQLSSLKKQLGKKSNCTPKIIYTLAKRPALGKVQLNWDLIRLFSTQKKLTRYLSNFKKKSFSVVNGESCQFYDLTQATDYRFVVNTFSCTLENLNELIISSGKRSIFENSTYFSASLIDKGVGPALFMSLPISLVIVAPPFAIVNAYPCDINSPTGYDENRKSGYLKNRLEERIQMDTRLVAYQEKHLNATDQIPSQKMLDNMIQCDNRYDSPSLNDHGCTPMPTPGGLLRDTSTYNEILIQGKRCQDFTPNISGHLLLIEKSKVDQLKNFEEEMLKLSQIEELSHGQIKVAVIETDKKYKPVKNYCFELLQLNRKLEEFKSQNDKQNKNPVSSSKASLKTFETLKAKAKSILALTVPHIQSLCQLSQSCKKK